MNSEFSRLLTLMRQEQGVSQRIAAGDMGVSQALLSHYENGIREPGLEFLVRACDYYGVTADFLLGRTLQRAQPGSCEEAQAEHRVSGCIDENCQMLRSAVCILLDIIDKSDDDAIITGTVEYLELSLYKVFRHLYNAVGRSPETFFSEPSTTFLFGSDAALKNAEQRLVTALSGPSYLGHTSAPGSLVQISGDSLAHDYPEECQSLLRIIARAGEIIKTT